MGKSTSNGLSNFFKLALILIAFFVLVKCGLNPFWSVLVIIYWRGLLKLALFLSGLVYLLTIMMY